MEDYAVSVDPEVRRGEGILPHSDLALFYGINNSKTSSDAFSFIFFNGETPARCNDGTYGVKEHTHKEIAARIREDFL